MSMPDVSRTRFNEQSLVAANNFRLLLDAMAKPGTVIDVPVGQNNIGPLNSGAAMALLALTDHETQVWLEESLATQQVVDYLKFYCSCPLVEKAKHAMFAVMPSQIGAFSLDEFSLGTPHYPDRSTTLIMQVDELSSEGSLVLSGPGINTTQSFGIEGLTNDFWRLRAEINKDFPMGIDLIFTTNSKLAALPRTTQLREIV